MEVAAEEQDKKNYRMIFMSRSTAPSAAIPVSASNPGVFLPGRCRSCRCCTCERCQDKGVILCLASSDSDRYGKVCVAVQFHEHCVAAGGQAGDGGRADAPLDAINSDRCAFG